MRKTVWAVSAVLLSGCVTLGPDYAVPDMNAPSKFVGGASSALRDASGSAWWQSFQDSALNELVSIGLTQNLDVKTAFERIVAARENTRRFGVVQQIDGDVSLDARRRSTDGVESDDASASAGALFVFDLFGEFRRAQEESLATFDAAQFDAGTVKLAYLSDIVTAYTQVRYYQVAAQITRETIASRSDTLNFVRERVDAQEGTQLEIAQAQSLLATAKATLPILEAQARVNSFRIATLLNVPTGVVAQKIDGGRAIPRPTGAAASGVPADLLRNRPDIRAAERRLAAATATVGITEAQLYPSLSLTGNVTLGETDAWSFGPSLALPVFDQVQRQASRNIALSEARSAELSYRQVFIKAIEEVQAALVLTNARQEQVEAYVTANASSERALNLARRSYEAGVVTVDDVLDADRTRLSNRLNLAQAQNDYALAWVQQQIAAGKGWAYVPGNRLQVASN